VKGVYDDTMKMEKLFLIAQIVLLRVIGFTNMKNSWKIFPTA
jgi:hypothetical protein